MDISICVSIYIPATECGKNLSPQILERLGGFSSKSGFLVYVEKSEAKDSVQARSPGRGRVAAASTEPPPLLSLFQSNSDMSGFSTPVLRKKLTGFWCPVTLWSAKDCEGWGDALYGEGV